MESVEYIAGGATLNSMRVCQWMLNQNSNKCCFFGSIGTKEMDLKHNSKLIYCDYLKECVISDGVHANFFQHPLYPTGTCAVCINSNTKERTVVGNLGASKDGFKIFDADLDDIEKSLINNNNNYKQYIEKIIVIN